MTREVSLPSWAKVIGKGVVEADASEFYPALLDELGVKEVDQYWLAIAFNCMKADVALGVAGTDSGATPGGALRIHVVDPTKVDNEGTSLWALKRHPEGKGELAGVKGFKEHYQRIRPGIAV